MVLVGKDVHYSLLTCFDTASCMYLLLLFPSIRLDSVVVQCLGYMLARTIRSKPTVRQSVRLGGWRAKLGVLYFIPSGAKHLPAARQGFRGGVLL